VSFLLFNIHLKTKAFNINFEPQHPASPWGFKATFRTLKVKKNNETLMRLPNQINDIVCYSSSKTKFLLCQTTLWLSLYVGFLISNEVLKRNKSLDTF
jgi:hypothetical protein